MPSYVALTSGEASGSGNDGFQGPLEIVHDGQDVEQDAGEGLQLRLGHFVPGPLAGVVEIRERAQIALSHLFELPFQGRELLRPPSLPAAPPRRFVLGFRLLGVYPAHVFASPHLHRQRSSATKAAGKPACCTPDSASRASDFALVVVRHLPCRWAACLPALGTIFAV